MMTRVQQLLSKGQPSEQKTNPNPGANQISIVRTKCTGSTHPWEQTIKAMFHVYHSSCNTTLRIYASQEMAGFACSTTVVETAMTAAGTMLPTAYQTIIFTTKLDIPTPY